MRKDPGRALVSIVDDDPAVRDSLELLLEGDGYRVASYASGEEFLRAPPQEGRHCVVIDVQLPHVSGIEVVRTLKKTSRATPVIFMTAFADIPLAVKAMKEGASDFIEKPFDAEVMLASVESALAASAPIAFDAGEKFAIRARFDRLTKRERDVMALLIEGLPNKVIAGRLGISPRTVEIHRANVMDKMESSSLPHLVRMALRGGFSPV